MSTYIAEKSETTETNQLNIDNNDLDNIGFTNIKTINNKLSAGIFNKETNSGYLEESTELRTKFHISYYGMPPPGKTVLKETNPEDRQWSVLTEASKNYPYEKFYDKLRLFNEKTLNWCVENSKIIFKKEKTKEQVEALFTSDFQQNIGKDGTVYLEQIQIRFNRIKDTVKPNVLIFKNSVEPLTINSFEELSDLIPKDSIIKVILQPQLRLNKQNCFCLKFYAKQILIIDIKKKNNLNSYAFSNLPVNEKNEEDNSKRLEETPKVLKESQKDLEENTKDLEENTKDSEENSDYEVEINDD
jgi:hypothetical protein